MFKKIFLTLAVLMAIPFVGATAQVIKIGLVDVTTIIQAMPERTAAETKLGEASKKYETEYQKLGEEMKRLYDEYQAMKPDELQAIKDRKTRELNDYQQKMAQFEQSAQNDLAKMQQELMAPIVQKIRTAIEAVGKEGNYSLVQDYNPQLTYYYASPVEDITPAVKAKLGLK